jgi:hypothetical protein
MPITYEIDQAAEIAVVRLSGDVTGTEFERYFKDTRENPRFSMSLKRIIITLGVTSFPSSSEVASLAMEIRRRTTDRSVRFAVVADSPLAIGIANMLLGQAGMADRYTTFSDEASARAWLTNA